MVITGTHINYYFHCKRHLWLFANHLTMEHTSETVAVGKVVAETTYPYQTHNLSIVTARFSVVIDLLDRKNNIVHEVKKSDAMEELHEWQLKFYLYVLAEEHIATATGVLNYPKLRQTKPVVLTNADRAVLEEAITAIPLICAAPRAPKVITMPFCKQCSYYELCYI